MFSALNSRRVQSTKGGLPFDIGKAANCAKSLSEPLSLPHYWENTVYLLCHCKRTDGPGIPAIHHTFQSGFPTPHWFCLSAGIECLDRARTVCEPLTSALSDLLQMSARATRKVSLALRSVASPSTWPVTRYH